jgi:hypothetical protein
MMSHQNTNSQADQSLIRRVRRIAVIKATLATVVLLIMVFTFPYPLPLAVAVLDLLLVGVYVVVAPRYPHTSTYLLVVQTALALTPRQFVQGYVNGINWVLYIPLPLAAAYVLGTRRSVWRAAALVSAVALPVTSFAALSLPPRIERAEVLTLIAYILVVLWGVAWLHTEKVA